MFELTVQGEFCAAHSIRIAGEREPLHGHNFRVSVCVSSEALDADGLVCDFHAVERALREVLRPLHNADLGTTPPFDRVNPTAEEIARHIAGAVGSGLKGVLPAGARISAVSVTEAPGCTATYKPPIMEVR